MKLKTKLLGLLSACAVVSTASLATVVACEADKFDNKVIFNGSREITPEVQGRKTAIVSGFSLGRELNEGNVEALAVESTNPKVIASIVGGERPEKDFSVQLEMLVDDDNVDQREALGLIFTFYRDGVAQRKTRLSAFALNYMSVWAVKTIVATDGSGKTLTPDAGQTSYSTLDFFNFDAGAKLKSTESVKLTLEGDDADKFTSEVRAYNNKVGITLQLDEKAIADPFESETFDIDFHFYILYGGIVKWNHVFDGYQFKYKGKWDAPTVTLEGYSQMTNIEFTADQVTHIKYVSKPNDSTPTGFKLSRALTAGESIETDISNPFISVQATANEEDSQWLDLDIQILEDKQFDPYEAKDFPFILSFLTSKPGYEQNKQTIFSHNFKVKYLPLPKPKDWSISFPTSYTSYAGEKRLSFIGYYQAPTGTFPEESPLVSISIKEQTSTTGVSKLKFNTDKFEKGYEETYNFRFATMFLDIVDKEDWYAAEEFDITFEIKFIEAVTVSDTQVLKMHIKYVPYDDPTATGYVEDPEQYVADRSMALSCLYPDEKSLTHESHHSGTAWIVGDATPSDLTDRKYYVVTTWKQKTEYARWRSSQSISNLYFGVSDVNMSMPHEDGNNYSLIDEHFYYIEPSNITILSDSECEDKFLWQDIFDFLFVHTDGQGINASVMTIDFAGDATLQGFDIYRNFEHQRDMYNKLDKLQAYKAKLGTNGKITRLQDASTTSNGKFFVMGSNESSLPFDGTQHTAYTWTAKDQISISGETTSSLIESFVRNTSTWEELWGTDAIELADEIDWLTPGWKFVEQQTDNWWEESSALGSMMLSWDTSGKIYVAGLYTGILTTKTETSTHYPRFDCFYGYSDITDTNINILAYGGYNN